MNEFIIEINDLNINILQDIISLSSNILDDQRFEFVNNVDYKLDYFKETKKWTSEYIMKFFKIDEKSINSKIKIYQ